MSGDATWTVRTSSAGQTRALGRALGARSRAGDLLVLTGELGAGKTTFTQGLAEGLGVRGPITSPTFVLARVHPSLVGGPALVHVDAYRLGSAAEVDDLDLDATAASAVTVVEWGAGLVEQLADERLEVALTSRGGAPGGPGGAGGPAGGGGAGDEARTVALRAVGPRWAGALDDLDALDDLGGLVGGDGAADAEGPPGE